jgi:hypothetical protein
VRLVFFSTCLVLTTACLPVIEPPSLNDATFDADGDGTANMDDCGSDDETVFPGAEELCDGLRNDCSAGEDVPVDEIDGDGDGFVACEDWVGSSDLSGLDCNDDDITIHPEASEEPGDQIDSDCNGLETCFIDADGDGFPSAYVQQSSSIACDEPGVTLAGSLDCDDDEETILAEAVFYPDLDNDGYGDRDAPPVCDRSAGILNHTDCDDDAAFTNPAAPELCDGADNDCDGVADEPGDLDDPAAVVWYVDNDSDGYGVGTGKLRCGAPTGGFSEVGGDCDDGDAKLYPGLLVYLDCDRDGSPRRQSVDACDNFGDQNCAAEWTQPSKSKSDCDDTDALYHHEAVWYDDVDGDGYGNLETVVACAPDDPTDVDNPNDCDDSDYDAVPGQSWWSDCDSDGSWVGPITQCDRPVCDGKTKTVEPNGEADCNDADEFAKPDQTWWVDCDDDEHYIETDIQCERPLCGGEAAPGLVTEDPEAPDCDDSRIDVHTEGPWYVDCDGDGYYLNDSVGPSCVEPTDVCADAPEANYTKLAPALSDDCDDSDDSVNPLGVWYPDCDGDGAYDYGNGTISCEEPTADAACEGVAPALGDWTTKDSAEEDCDDEDPILVPDQTWYPDCDEDGAYDVNFVRSCEVPLGACGGEPAVPTFVTLEPGAGDCRDDDATRHPGTRWHLDCDGDDAFSPEDVQQCEEPVTCQWGPLSEPNAAMVDAVDPFDCDDTEYEIGAADFLYADCDDDGFAREAGTYVCDTESMDEAPCAFPVLPTWSEEAAEEPDCNDENDDWYPGREWYPDCDGDGVAVATSVATQCAAPEEGCEGDAAPLAWMDTSPVATDCIDDDASRYPGAPEVPADGIDQDCDNVDHCWVDWDGDGFGNDIDGDGLGDDEDASAGDDLTCHSDTPDGLAEVAGDCDDLKAAINPGMPEICDNDVTDENCNGLKDGGDSTLGDYPAWVSGAWFGDFDEDGFGAGTGFCFELTGWVQDNTDCDGGNGERYPGAGCGITGTLEVSELDDDLELNGLSIFDTTTTKGAGQALAIVADANGDGYDEILIGSPEYRYNGQTGAGMASLFKGAFTGWADTFDLYEDGVPFVTGGHNDRVGEAVLGLGDMFQDDGLEYGDIAISIHGLDEGTNFSVGAVYLFSGLPSSWTDADVIVQGDGSSDWIGGALAAPDLNGDFIPDLVVGGDDNELFVFLSPIPDDPAFNEIDNTINVSAAGLTLTGYDDAGLDVENVGDFDGDGREDLATGDITYYTPGGPGAAWLVTDTVDLIAASPGNNALSDAATAVFVGEVLGDKAGTSIAAAGDIDNDGYADFAVGAPGYDDVGSNEGAVYLVFGQVGLSLASSEPLEDGVRLIGSGSAGHDVSFAGDTNHDSLGEIAICNRGGGINDKLFLVQPTVSTGNGEIVASASLVASVQGEVGDDFCEAVAGGGDVDGDGSDDLLIGAPGYGSPAVPEGRVYLLLGSGN